MDILIRWDRLQVFFLLNLIIYIYIYNSIFKLFFFKDVLYNKFPGVANELKWMYYEEHHRLTYLIFGISFKHV